MFTRGNAARVRFGALTAALAMAAAGCGPAQPSYLATLAPTTPSPRAPAGPTVVRAAWNDCGGGYQCTTIKVPEDYANPGGRRIELSVIRLPATSPEKRIGALIVNPGGPGGSGSSSSRTTSSSFLPRCAAASTSWGSTHAG